MKSLPLSFRVRQLWPLLILLLVTCILIFQITTLQRNSARQMFRPLMNGDGLVYLRHLLVYFCSFESISAGIIILFLRSYRQWFGLCSLTLTVRGVIRYEAAFLPALLLVIPLFGPITNTLRFLVLYGLNERGNYGWSDYFPEYVFTPKMFANYFLPVLVFGYAYINVNLFLDILQEHTLQAPLREPTANGSPQEELPPGPLSVSPIEQLAPYNLTLTPPAPVYQQYVDAYDHTGQTCLRVDEVLFFTVKEKNYWLQTQAGSYKLRKTMAELESELDPRVFFRLNRSVLVNIRKVKNYSYWEYDKYIVRMVGEANEFIMPRQRLRAFKQCLHQQGAVESETGLTGSPSRKSRIHQSPVGHSEELMSSKPPQTGFVKG